MINETALICGGFLSPLCKTVKMRVILFLNKTRTRQGKGREGEGRRGEGRGGKGMEGREGGVCVCKCNVCECYSAVLVIRLTYTSTKTCIKNEWHDYNEYIYPFSISKLREGYALSKCVSFASVNALFPIPGCSGKTLLPTNNFLRIAQSLGRQKKVDSCFGLCS